MEFQNETPSKSTIVKKVLTSRLSCDSPFKFIPNVSTPPSRFTKIFNPFETHLSERLLLPTFSPSVFRQSSTPTKTEEKFKWTIDDISRMKPADIDEESVLQHVSMHDPTVESVLQEKIEQFFSDTAVAASPFTDEEKGLALLQDSPLAKTECSDGATQTVLTLPPVLPKHVEEALKPYFTYTKDQQTHETDPGSSLYQKLFNHEECDRQSVESSPPLSHGLSPIQLSFTAGQGSVDNSFEIPELKDCILSPIGRYPIARSACRLSFSGHMSVDGSLVPDVNHLPSRSCSFNDLEQHSSQDLQQSSTVNWDMEFNEVAFESPSPPKVSNPETPRSKMFPSQRKRLSDSFKNEETRDIEMQEQIKNRLTNATDSGFHTETTADFSIWNNTNICASTPTKNK